jgi:hypothetical protein
VVFDDGENYLLADGYHRWHAHRAFKHISIAATVIKGSRRDALRHALGANSDHGKRRELGDFRRAYERAVAHGLVGPSEAERLRRLLNCTKQWAYRLTEQARAEADRARDAEIAERKAAGQSVRLIARELRLPKSTVQDAAVRKINTLKPGHAPVLDHDLGVSEDTSRSACGTQKITPLVSTLPPLPVAKHSGRVIADVYSILHDVVDKQIKDGSFIPHEAATLALDKVLALDKISAEGIPNILPLILVALCERARSYVPRLNAAITAAQRNVDSGQADFSELDVNFSRMIRAPVAMGEGANAVRLPPIVIEQHPEWQKNPAMKLGQILNIESASHAAAA